MRLPSRLLCSRHGVHYLRVIIPKVLRNAFAGRREFRYSLQTKDANEARSMARIINARIDYALMQLKGETMAGVRKVRLDEVGLNITSDLSNYKLKRHQDGSIEVEASDAEDHKRAMEALALSIAPITPTARTAPPAYHLPAPANSVGLTETIANYAALEAPKISGKTAYEYERMQRKFLRWMQEVRNRRDPPMHTITRDDIKAYLKHLQAVEKLSPYTIDAKYLPALTGLFLRARRDSAYPDNVELPTVRLRTLSKKALEEKRAKQKLDKPYSSEELKLIFAPRNLTTATKPHQFWLPLIALFTGARLNEICQLHLEDITQDDGIWVFNINNKGVKRLKTSSAVRKVPISQTLIDIGLLEYVEDVKALGGAQHKNKILPAPKMVFPYLNRDKQGGHFTHDATREWTAYRKFVGVRVDADEDRGENDGGIHPFRYVFTNVLVHQNVRDEVREQLLGHKEEGVNREVYSQKFTLQYLSNDVMPLVKFPEVNFAGIRYAAMRERFRKFLVPAIAKRLSRAEHLATIAKNMKAEADKAK